MTYQQVPELSNQGHMLLFCTITFLQVPELSNQGHLIIPLHAPRIKLSNQSLFPYTQCKSPKLSNQAC